MYNCTLQVEDGHWKETDVIKMTYLGLQNVWLNIGITILLSTTYLIDLLGMHEKY